MNGSILVLLFTNYVDDFDDFLVKVGHSGVSTDDFLPDDISVSLHFERTAFEAGAAESFLDHLFQGRILGGYVYDGRQYHAGQFEEHPASGERADLDQVVLLGVQVDLIGSTDRGHLVLVRLIQAQAIDPQPVRPDLGFAEQQELDHGVPLLGPLVGDHRIG